MLVSKVWDSYQSRDWNYPDSLSWVIENGKYCFIMWQSVGAPLVYVSFDDSGDNYDIFSISSDGIIFIEKSPVPITGDWIKRMQESGRSITVLETKEAFNLIKEFESAMYSISRINNVLATQRYKDTKLCRSYGKATDTSIPLKAGISFSLDHIICENDISSQRKLSNPNEELYKQPDPLIQKYPRWGYDKSLKDLIASWETCMITVDFSQEDSNGIYPIAIYNTSPKLATIAEYEFDCDDDEEVVNPERIGITDDGFISLHNDDLLEQIGIGRSPNYMVIEELPPRKALENAILFRNLIKNKKEANSLFSKCQGDGKHLAAKGQLSMILTTDSYGQIDYQNDQKLLSNLREVYNYLHFNS